MAAADPQPKKPNLKQIGIVAVAARDGFVADGIDALVAQRFEQQACDVGFADPGIRACDKITHGQEVADGDGRVKTGE